LIVLDENILDGQRLLLEASRMATRQIGVNLGRKGMKDEEIVVLLRRQRNIVFFTRDADFYLPELRHPRYCLVVMNVGQNEVAAFVRRFLRHPDFDTQVKRIGKVIRISHVGLAIWRSRTQAEIHAVWSRSK
jgi:predicted nuclease of predicted toxin-antitoxin system